MENLSHQMCFKCNNFEDCISTVIYHPELQVKCIHFRHATKIANELMTNIKDELNKYITDYFAGNKEN